MADLSELSSSGSTKIVGSDLTGQEQSFVQSDTSGNLLVKDAADGIVGSTVSSIVTGVGAKDIAGNLQVLLVDTLGKLSVIQTLELSTLQGQTFSLTSGDTTIASVTETPLLLISNPIGSGKIMKISSIGLGSANANNTFLVYKFYISPTVTANGTAIAVVGSRQTSQNTPVTNIFRTPTVTANGNIYKQFRTGTAGHAQLDINFSFWVEANQKMLITVTSTAVGIPAYINLSYKEET